jgi:hypothetical protein
VQKKSCCSSTKHNRLHVRRQCRTRSNGLSDEKQWQSKFKFQNQYLKKTIAPKLVNIHNSKFSRLLSQYTLLYAMYSWYIQCRSFCVEGRMEEWSRVKGPAIRESLISIFAIHLHFEFSETLKKTISSCFCR